MERWTCAVCGKLHGDLPMDIAFQRPQQFFEVPEVDRADRIWMNAAANADFCVLDAKVFLVRAFRPIQVEGNRTFRFGVWVRVDEAAFSTYHSCARDLDNPPSYAGYLASEVPAYPKTLDLSARVQLAGHNDRPTIKLDVCDHPLVLEQQNGITLLLVHEILERCFPTLFGEQTPPN
jgi:hypothetical protein